MGICADGDDFAAKLPVTADDGRTWVGFPKTIVIATGVDLKPHICVHQLFQDPVQNILIFFIRIELVFIGALADNIIQMPISVHFMEGIQILQNGFEIFKVCLFLVPTLEKFGVVGISAMDYVRGTNYKVKGIFF